MAKRNEHAAAIAPLTKALDLTQGRNQEVLEEWIAAMSAVREVDVEPQHPVDPQGAIDRAIATLDREARGESVPPVNGANLFDGSLTPDR